MYIVISKIPAELLKKHYGGHTENAFKWFVKKHNGNSVIQGDCAKTLEEAHRIAAGMNDGKYKVITVYRAKRNASHINI